MKKEQVKLTVSLTDGRKLSCVYDYVSASQRVIEAKRWPLFKEWKVEGPAASLVAPLVLNAARMEDLLNDSDA